MFRFSLVSCLAVASIFFPQPAFAAGASIPRSGTFEVPAVRSVEASRENIPPITAISVHIRRVDVLQEGYMGDPKALHLGHLYFELWTGNNVPFRTLEAGSSGTFGNGYLVAKHYPEHPMTDVSVFLKFGSGSVGEMTRAGQRLSLEQDFFDTTKNMAILYGGDIDNSNSYVTALLSAYGCPADTYDEAVSRLQDDARLTAVGSQTGAQIAVYMEPLGRPYPDSPKCAAFDAHNRTAVPYGKDINNTIPM